MPTGKVLLFGDINVDNILSIPGFPQPGHDGLATYAETHLGGAVCNSAVILQQFGQKAVILGSVGNDQWGNYAVDELSRLNVDISCVIRKKNSRSGLIFIAVTNNGERTMFCYRGANTEISPEDISPSILDDISLVQISGYVFLESPQRDTAWKLIQMAHSQNIPISMDSGLDPVILKRDEIKRVLPYLSLFITGEEEIRCLTKAESLTDQVRELVSYGIEWVSIKLGGGGAMLAWDSGELSLPAFDVVVKDTTGAGDAFSAAIIYAYLNKFNPSTSLVLANALGGLATTVFGGARINRDELTSFLQDYQKSHPSYPEGEVLNQLINMLINEI